MSSDSATSESSRSSSLSPIPKPKLKPRSNKLKRRYVPTLPVCKFYNSYFKSGCVHGDKCSFRHLSQREFSKYCRTLSVRKPLSPNEIFQFKEGQRHFREHRYQTARKLFGALCSKYPFHQGLNIWLARTHDKVFMHSDKLSNIGSATYYYRRAISIDPDNAYYHGRYASCSYWLGQHERCRVHFEQSLHLKNDNSSVHRDYGHYLHHIEHRLDLAEEHYLRCLELFENDHDCHYFYATMLEEQQRNEEAVCQYTQAIKYQARRWKKGKLRFHLAFARCLRKMGKFDKSKVQYMMCLQLNEMNSVVLFELGELLCNDIQEMEDYKEGLKHIRTSLNIQYREDWKRTLDQLTKRHAAMLRRERRETPRQRVHGHLEERRHHHEQRPLQTKHRERVYTKTRGYDHEVTSKRKVTSGHGVISRHEVTSGTATGYETRKRTETRKEVEKPRHLVDDDDEKSEPKGKEAEGTLAMNIAQRIRESEFERFMNFQSFLNDQVRGEYLAEFKRRNLNDIILLKIDTNTFVDELGIRNLLHATLIKKRIDRFKRELKVFHDWLIRMRMEETVEVFEKFGILTFESFDHHIKSECDLKWLLGHRMKKHADIIMAQRRCRKRTESLGVYIHSNTVAR